MHPYIKCRSIYILHIWEFVTRYICSKIRRTNMHIELCIYTYFSSDQIVWTMLVLDRFSREILRNCCPHWMCATPVIGAVFGQRNPDIQISKNLIPTGIRTGICLRRPHNVRFNRSSWQGQYSKFLLYSLNKTVVARLRNDSRTPVQLHTLFHCIFHIILSDWISVNQDLLCLLSGHLYWVILSSACLVLPILHFVQYTTLVSRRWFTGNMLAWIS